jgi:membrane associated rhomboid family serine protease
MPTPRLVALGAAFALLVLLALFARSLDAPACTVAGAGFRAANGYYPLHLQAGTTGAAQAETRHTGGSFAKVTRRGAGPITAPAAPDLFELTDYLSTAPPAAPSFELRRMKVDAATRSGFLGLPELESSPGTRSTPGAPGTPGTPGAPGAPGTTPGGIDLRTAAVAQSAIAGAATPPTFSSPSPLTSTTFVWTLSLASTRARVRYKGKQFPLVVYAHPGSSTDPPTTGWVVAHTAPPGAAPAPTLTLQGDHSLRAMAGEDAAALRGGGGSGLGGRLAGWSARMLSSKSLMMTDIRTKPQTLLVVVGCCLFWFALWNNRLGWPDVGISYRNIVFGKEYWRVLSASFAHIDLLHLVVNMSSVYNLGSLEMLYGAPQFFSYTMLFVVATQAVSLAMYHALIHHRVPRPQYANTIAVGYSCVLFGWLVVACIRMKQYCPIPGFTSFCLPTWHIPLPVPWGGGTGSAGTWTLAFNLAPFLMLGLIQVIMPKVSFVGHLSGIVLGFPVAWGFAACVKPAVLVRWSILGMAIGGFWPRVEEGGGGSRGGGGGGAGGSGSGGGGGSGAMGGPAASFLAEARRYPGQVAVVRWAARVAAGVAVIDAALAFAHMASSSPNTAIGAALAAAASAWIAVRVLGAAKHFEEDRGSGSGSGNGSGSGSGWWNDAEEAGEADRRAASLGHVLWCLACASGLDAALSLCQASLLWRQASLLVDGGVSKTRLDVLLAASVVAAIAHGAACVVLRQGAHVFFPAGVSSSAVPRARLENGVIVRRGGGGGRGGGRGGGDDGGGGGSNDGAGTLASGNEQHPGRPGGGEWGSSGGLPGLPTVAPPAPLRMIPDPPSGSGRSGCHNSRLLQGK